VRLTDIMSHMALHVWAEVALVIFLVVFVAVAARVLLTPGPENRRRASLPLEEDGGSGLFEEVG